MTKPTPDLTGLPQEVQESLQAGRINFSQANAISHSIHHHGKECGLSVLKQFEKLNCIEAYYEFVAFGFKIHEFAFDCRLTSPEEREKIATALKEALTTLELYSKLEVSK